MPPVCHAVDRMGDTRVLFKCATAVRLCVARAAHVLRHAEIPNQRTRASSVGKTPSFGFCQVEMYDCVTTQNDQIDAFTNSKPE